MIYRICVLLVGLGLVGAAYFFIPPPAKPALPQIAIKKQEVAEVRREPLKVQQNQEIHILAIDETTYLDAAEESTQKKEAVAVLRKGLKRYENSPVLQEGLMKLRPAVSVNRGGGNYSGRFALNLSSDPGASILYTLNGADPRQGKAYTGPIWLSYGNTQLRTIAAFEGLEGEELTQNYLIRPAPPIFNKNNTVVEESVTIYLNNNDPDLDVYYAFDEVPTAGSEWYDSRLGIEVFRSCTIGAIAVSSDGLVSDVAYQEISVIFQPEGSEGWWYRVRPANRAKVIKLLEDNPDALLYQDAISSGALTDLETIEQAQILRRLGRTVFYLPSSNRVQGFA